MKIKTIFFILFMASLMLNLPAYALQASNSITATVLVQGSFYLMVNTDSFDFARMAPGQTGEMTRPEGVTVTGASSGGSPWYLKVSTKGPLASGINSIPNENFTWYGTSEGSGTWYGNQEKSFADPTSTAYMSSADETEKVSRVVNNFKFHLRAPEDTKPGYYTTTVMFTMTE